MQIQTQTQGLGAIGQAVSKHLGISEQALREPGPMPEISGSIPIQIAVTNGSGSYTSPQETTFWVTISGTMQITAPSGGTWSVNVIDLKNGNAVVFNQSGMAQDRRTRSVPTRRRSTANLKSPSRGVRQPTRRSKPPSATRPDRRLVGAALRRVRLRGTELRPARHLARQTRAPVSLL